jgi:lipooligosaccharide transport system permease protein
MTGFATLGRRLRRLEGAALMGVLVREVVNFKSYWRSTTFSSILDPTVYLLAFGFGFGTIVSEVAGYEYKQFVGTGIVATGVLFASAFPGIFSTLVKWQYQNTYSAMLAAPVDTEELVTGEAAWIAFRAGVYGCAPLIVSFFFGLDPSGGMLLVPFIGMLTGFGFACFGIFVAGQAQRFDNVNYVISGVLTPLFLVAGTFFPIEEMPEWARIASEFNPLYHCVELVRHAAFGFEGATDLWHVAALALFGLLMWRLAIWRMHTRLVD